MTRIEEIQARLKAATLKNELKQAYHYQPVGYKPDLYAVSWNGQYRVGERLRFDLAEDMVRALEFAIDAPADLAYLLAEVERLGEVVEAAEDHGFEKALQIIEIKLNDGEERNSTRAAAAKYAREIYADIKALAQGRKVGG